MTFFVGDRPAAFTGRIGLPAKVGGWKKEAKQKRTDPSMIYNKNLEQRCQNAFMHFHKKCCKISGV